MSELTIVKNIKKCANMKYKEIYATMLVGTANACRNLQFKN